jgi:hypothetical protein
MLTDPSNLPANSTTPLPANYGQRSAQDMYDLFAMGLTAKFASQCVAPPSSFVFPQSNLIPQVTSNPASPALSTAIAAPSVVPPIQAQVYQAQQAQAQMLTGRSNALNAVMDAAAGQGASYNPSDFADAAEVIPMGTTSNMVAEAGGQNKSNARLRASRGRRKAPGGGRCQPQPPWGGESTMAPAGVPSGAKWWIWAGLALIGFAIVSGKR